MTARDVLAQARAAGLKLTADGGNIRWRGPKGALTPEMKATIVEHKGELLVLLVGEQSASVLPFRLPHPVAAGTLMNCVRIKPGSAASEQDIADLQTHYDALGDAAEGAVQRIWRYWKSAAQPTVAEFLTNEKGRRAHA